MGSILMLLCTLDVDASDNVLTSDFHYKGSQIWFLATHAWMYVSLDP